MKIEIPHPSTIEMPRASSASVQLHELFQRHGHQPHEDARAGSITAREHALQCAQLAEWADADASLVLAALLHDIGHFFVPDPRLAEPDREHDLLPVPFLKRHFGPEVFEPIRLHVQAKRYLVAVDGAYFDLLGPATRQSVWSRGGPMCVEELRLFEQLPFAQEAISLATWDDMAREPGKHTPPLSRYLALICNVNAESHRTAHRRRSAAPLPEAAGVRYLF